MVGMCQEQKAIRAGLFLRTNDKNVIEKYRSEFEDVIKQAIKTYSSLN